MPNSELEDIENQIIELTKSYFDLKQSSENSFVPSISAVPVSGKVLDSEDISNMVIHNTLKPYSNENSEGMSNIEIKNFYMLKYNNLYLCTHNKRRLFDSWNGFMETTNNPFFEVEYNDNKYQISIDIPKSYFIVGNELLSSIFLKRWFDYTVMPDDFIFTNNYTIKITDEDFNEFELKNNEYILLNQNGYSIQKIK